MYEYYEKGPDRDRRRVRIWKLKLKNGESGPARAWAAGVRSRAPPGSRCGAKILRWLRGVDRFVAHLARHGYIEWRVFGDRHGGVLQSRVASSSAMKRAPVMVRVRLGLSIARRADDWQMPYHAAA